MCPTRSKFSSDGPSILHRGFITFTNENFAGEALYKQYFEEEKHPSTPETLLEAAKAAGIDEKKAKDFIDDEYECLQDVKMAIREQVSV